MFETVSFHLVKPCNMGCKFCYATFQDFRVGKQLTLEECCKIVDKLHQAGVKKITFAGGEPMLFKELDLLIIYTKLLGITTSIITNGSLLTREWLQNMIPYLDWIGISIDSTNQETNRKIGRVTRKSQDHQDSHYYALLATIKSYGYKLKVNTVVNIHNQDEKLVDFIEHFEVDRWKVFDTLKVEGQNDQQFEEIKSTDFNGFVLNNLSDVMVVETNYLMTASYLLIDPLGRLFENSKGKHTYSDSILEKDFNECLSQISLDRNKFLERGGIYKWS